MISETLVDLSRFQFAMTAMYHFIFVPLTIGLAFLLAIMESVYVLTGKEVNLINLIEICALAGGNLDN